MDIIVSKRTLLRNNNKKHVMNMFNRRPGRKARANAAGHDFGIQVFGNPPRTAALGYCVPPRPVPVQRPLRNRQVTHRIPLEDPRWEPSGWHEGEEEEVEKKRKIEECFSIHVTSCVFPAPR